jgi:hypothetical protein
MLTTEHETNYPYQNYGFICVVTMADDGMMASPTTAKRARGFLMIQGQTGFQAIRISDGEDFLTKNQSLSPSIVQ